MKPKNKVPKDVDGYIAIQPAAVQPVLQQLRNTIKKAAPNAEEVISYQMPAYKLNGVLVYFAAWKEHIGFYPASAGISHFSAKLAKYNTSKGTIQFPLSEKLPLKLIADIVKLRVKENKAKALKKKAVAKVIR
jgi:uncharacterized protein YdhG (YjbR/CyaY superfamily)